MGSTSGALGYKHKLIENLSISRALLAPGLALRCPCNLLASK